MSNEIETNELTLRNLTDDELLNIAMDSEHPLVIELVKRIDSLKLMDIL